MRILLKADAVRESAARQGETLKDLGRRAGIDPSHFSRSLSNQHELSPPKRRALLNALGLDFDSVFEIERAPTKKAGAA